MTKKKTSKTTTTAPRTMDDKSPAGSSDLVDRMRRLSVHSHTSSFSLVSAVSSSSSPSVQSLDSHGSIAGGIQVAQGPEQSLVAVKQKQKQKQGKSRRRRRRPAVPSCSSAATADVATISGDRLVISGIQPQHQPQSTLPAITTSTTTTSTTTTACPFWYQFEGFEPSPAARFRAEFSRLAKQQGWGSSQRRKRELEALRAEIAFHHATCEHKLVQWQKLCEETSVDADFSSINQCKRALKKVYINLWDVVDHRRNPAFPITHLASYAQFHRAVFGRNAFPREIAKLDGFINVLLKRTF